MSEPEKNDSSDLNMNVQIHGGQNLVGNNTVHGGVHQHVGQPQPTIEEIYRVIREAIPSNDTDAIAAAKYLESEEQNAAKDAQPPDGVVRSQSIVARYKTLAIAALKEMGLMWLRAALPQVVFVEPLIRLALDALEENVSG